MVVGVCIIIHFYKHDLMEVDIGNTLRFYADRRVVNIDRGEKLDQLVGRLGESIPTNLLPFNCLGSGVSRPSDLCMEWRGYAKLTVHHSAESSTDCYNVIWIANKKDLPLKDCFSLGQAHWYGSEMLSGKNWPLEQISHPLQAYVSGGGANGEYGGVLERYWLSSLGVSLRVSEATPLHVSLNESGDRKLCLVASYERYIYANPNISKPHLNYTVCTAPGMKLAHEHYLAKLSKPSCLNEALVTQFMWTTNPTTGDGSLRENVMNLATQIQLHGMAGGSLIFNSNWESEYGDFVFDEERFPDPDTMIAVIKGRNLSLALRVHPYSNIDSVSFVEGAAQEYWVKDGSGIVPGLTKWQYGITAVLDVTNVGAHRWWVDRLIKVHQKYGLEGFSVGGGEMALLPYMHKFSNPKTSTVSYVTEYIQMVEELNNSLRATSAATLQKLNCSTVRITDVTIATQTQFLGAPVRSALVMPTWNDGPATIIPTVLTVGLLGYPLVIAPPLHMDLLAGLPDRELYVRWLQIALCMPVVQLSLPPWEYDQEVQAIGQKALMFREEVVVPEILAQLEEAQSQLHPIVRPLWWDSPDDETAQVTFSQFLIGNDLMVAPALTSGSPAVRDIYLPSGKWADNLAGGSILTGPMWIKEYRVLLDSIPHFTRVR